MTNLELKFDTGKKVWFEHDRKIYEARIVRIATLSPESSQRTRAAMNIDTIPLIPFDRCFSTKEEAEKDYIKRTFPHLINTKETIML